MLEGSLYHSGVADLSFGLGVGVGVGVDEVFSSVIAESRCGMKTPLLKEPMGPV